MASDCAGMEMLAGAIALDEATDAERERYRMHLAACARCVQALGGERDIERVMSLFAQARDEETWTPDAAATIRSRVAQRKRVWTAGASAIGLGVAISLGAHALLAAGMHAIAPTPSNPIEIAFDGERVSIERRPHPVTVHRAGAGSGLLVERTVVHLAPPVARVPVPRPRFKSTPSIARGTPEQVVAVQAWERAHPVAAGTDTSGVIAPAAPALVNRAESLAVAPEVRDVSPIGGPSAIVPRPAPIAYAQGAEGTTEYAVDVDERGSPVKCSIEKSSGYLALDDAVCAAAMKAQYAPRTVGGRPVAATFRDAITFRVDAVPPGIQSPP